MERIILIKTRMTAAMEEARRLLYEKVIKKFTLQEITKHKTFR
jgi:hypothetical protein